MHDSAAIIPFVLTAKVDGFAALNAFDSWCEIYVVADQYGVVRGHGHQEALVLSAPRVVGQNRYDFAPAFDDDVGAFRSKGRNDRVV
jgi:hypothetical protein